MRTVLIVVILSVGLFGCDRGEQEIIVVPRDYTGFVLVILNQKNGSPAKYDGKKRVYEIQQSGILKTQFTENIGRREFPEYYYEIIAPENKLPSYGEIRKVPMDTVVGFMGANGTVKKSADSEVRIEFVEFYIGTKSQIEEAQQQLEKLDIVDLAQ